MACRVEKFSSLCLFACFYFNLWNFLCTCVVIMWDWAVCGWASVNWPGRRVNLQGKPHHPSTPRMSLSPWQHAPVLPLFLCPACLTQRCTPACLKLTLTWGFKQCWRQHTPQLLSHDWVKYHTPDTVHIFRKLTPKNMQCWTRSKHCSKPCWLFPQVHFMCYVFKFPWVKRIPQQACWL